MKGFLSTASYEHAQQPKGLYSIKRSKLEREINSNQFFLNWLIKRQAQMVLNIS